MKNLFLKLITVALGALFTQSIFSSSPSTVAANSLPLILDYKMERNGLWLEVTTITAFFDQQEVGSVEYKDGRVDGEAKIESLHVFSAHRRKGIAKILLTKALAAIRMQNKAPIDIFIEARPFKDWSPIEKNHDPKSLEYLVRFYSKYGAIKLFEKQWPNQDHIQMKIPAIHGVSYEK